jgi:hypothetical protein
MRRAEHEKALGHDLASSYDSLFLRRESLFGRNKTVVFTLSAPVSGEGLRIRFSNRFGTAPYEIGALRVFAGGKSCPVTLNGQQRFEVPTGGITVSDPCELSFKRGEEIQIRLYYTNAILDNNMIEEEANLCPEIRPSSLETSPCASRCWQNSWAPTTASPPSRRWKC